MPSPILNPRRSASLPPREPVQLSRELLHQARALETSSEALGALEALAGQLHDVQPAALRGDAVRLAFWLNVYNALVRHALHVYRPRGNLLLHLRLFSRAAYMVGGQRYSLNLVEHGLLRHNRPVPPFPWRTARPGDSRLEAAPERFEPRIHFALNCGARSCPPIRSYEPDRLEEQLELAAESYVRAEAHVEREARRVTLPRLLRYYRGDFGSQSEALRLVARSLPPPEGPWLAENAGRVRVRYGPYDWRVSPGGPA